MLFLFDGLKLKKSKIGVSKKKLLTNIILIYFNFRKSVGFCVVFNLRIIKPKAHTNNKFQPTK